MGSAVDWPLEVIVRAPSMLCSSLVRASFITQPPAGCVRTQAPASPPPAGCVRAIPNVEAHKQRRSARLQPAKSESPAPDSLSSRGHFFNDVASFSRLREAYNTCSDGGEFHFCLRCQVHWPSWRRASVCSFTWPPCMGRQATSYNTTRKKMQMELRLVNHILGW